MMEYWSSAVIEEPFVTADEAAEFLRCSPVTVKRLAREGKIPAHSIQNGVRRRWRFLISELSIAMKKQLSSTRSSAPLSQERKGKAV
jgi:excisionase family DNA binding protein